LTAIYYFLCREKERITDKKNNANPRFDITFVLFFTINRVVFFWVFFLFLKIEFLDEFVVGWFWSSVFFFFSLLPVCLFLLVSFFVIRSLFFSCLLELEARQWVCDGGDAVWGIRSVGCPSLFLWGMIRPVIRIGVYARERE